MNPRTLSFGSIDFDDGHACYQCDYRLEGKYRPRTQSSPVEYPEITVTHVVLWIGNVSIQINYRDLPTPLQEEIADCIAQQAFA